MKLYSICTTCGKKTSADYDGTAAPRVNGCKGCGREDRRFLVTSDETEATALSKLIEVQGRYRLEKALKDEKRKLREAEKRKHQAEARRNKRETARAAKVAHG